MLPNRFVLVHISCFAPNSILLLQAKLVLSLGYSGKELPCHMGR